MQPQSAAALTQVCIIMKQKCILAAPALDLDFLLDIIKEKRPLDWDAVLSSDVPLKVVASCLDTLQPVILEDFADAQDLETCLRASANVPEVSPHTSPSLVCRLTNTWEASPFCTVELLATQRLTVTVWERKGALLYAAITKVCLPNSRSRNL